MRRLPVRKEAGEGPPSAALRAKEKLSAGRPLTVSPAVDGGVRERSDATSRIVGLSTIGGKSSMRNGAWRLFDHAAPSASARRAQTSGVGSEASGCGRRDMEGGCAARLS